MTPDDLKAKGFTQNADGSWSKRPHGLSKRHLAPSPEELWMIYQETGSVHKVAERFGLTGETIRKYLLDGGYRLDDSVWSVEDLSILHNVMSRPNSESINMIELAKILKRTRIAVTLKAQRLGFQLAGRPKTEATLTKMSLVHAKRWEHLSSDERKERVQHLKLHWSNPRRGKLNLTDDQRRKISERFKRQIKENGHPRGMLGKHHSQAVRDAVSLQKKGKPIPREQILRTRKTKVEKYGPSGGLPKRGSWKQGWREIGQQRIYARSRWEANYARHLEFLRQQGEVTEWLHEPETFWFDKCRRGCVSYLPDFRIVFRDGRTEYHEVKGWMDKRSQTKIKRMAKYHPSVTLRVIDKEWFRTNNRNMAGLIQSWETK